MNKQTIDQQAVSQLVEKWAERTAQLEEERSRIPLSALHIEVLQVARVLETHWATRRTEGVLVHGLESVAPSAGIGPETAGEIRELQLTISEAQARYDVLLQQDANAPMERADEILSELRAVLSFLLEDGEHPDGEAQLTQVRQAHPKPASMQDVAMALEGYAELAELYKAELSQLSIFPLGIIDESLQIARQLREHSVGRKTGDLVSAQREALALRNRLIAGVMKRVTAGRRAIRYVFRDDPEVLRKVSSDYKRERRSQAESNNQGETSVNPDVAAGAA